MNAQKNYQPASWHIRSDCALCGARTQLCRSHIIPEFCYKPAYDEKHRILAVEVDNPDRVQIRQQGETEYLLCTRCERLLNDNYEKPFHDQWVASSALEQVRASRQVILRGFDYTVFKLFHLSVLVRAALSNRFQFSEVQIPDHHLNRLKEMVLQGDCGLAWEYPLIATAVALPGLNEASALIGPPHRIRLYGQWGYIFTFLGFQWLYFVSSHECTELRHIRLQTNGSLPTTCQPWLPIRKYLADWRVAQQGTSESQSLVEEKPASATITQPAMP